jgi:hypothetical protein
MDAQVLRPVRYSSTDRQFVLNLARSVGPQLAAPPAQAGRELQRRQPAARGRGQALGSQWAAFRPVRCPRPLPKTRRPATGLQATLRRRQWRNGRGRSNATGGTPGRCVDEDFHEWDTNETLFPPADLQHFEKWNDLYDTDALLRPYERAVSTRKRSLAERVAPSGPLQKQAPNTSVDPERPTLGQRKDRANGGLCFVAGPALRRDLSALPRCAIARKAEPREAHQHHRPGGGFRNRASAVCERQRHRLVQIGSRLEAKIKRRKVD